MDEGLRGCGTREVMTWERKNEGKNKGGRKEEL